MPRIEPYRQRTNVTGATEGTGEIVAGRGLAAVGAAINDVGDSVALVARRDAANVAAESIADLRVRISKRMLDAQNAAAADAAGFTDGVLSGFDSELSDVLDDILMAG